MRAAARTCEVSSNVLVACCPWDRDRPCQLLTRRMKTSLTTTLAMLTSPIAKQRAKPVARCKGRTRLSRNMAAAGLSTRCCKNSIATSRLRSGLLRRVERPNEALGGNRTVLLRQVELHSFLLFLAVWGVGRRCLCRIAVLSILT